MAKPEPSMDAWLEEAKADPKAAQCGMFLTHNGVVRITPKQQVREGVEGLGEVAQVEFSYDAEGVAAAPDEDGASAADATEAEVAADPKTSAKDADK